MPTNGDPVTGYAVDTSVAVPALDSGHAAHAACRAIVQRLRPALAGHAAFETFSVLTRMPGHITVDAPTAAEIIERVFETTVWLAPGDSAALQARLSATGIIGGAVYDALVGEAARVNGLQLLTRDRRATSTYIMLGTPYQLIEP